MILDSRGERGKMGQKNIFAHYEKNIHVTQKMFILHCRACFILLCKIFPWLWVSYFTRYTTFKNHKIFQKSSLREITLKSLVAEWLTHWVVDKWHGVQGSYRSRFFFLPYLDEIQ